ncbi:cellulase family glycosylhydrolase [Candidatus Daviesbacteria bacterium]|nr:cellulase family glycosylhydrolase [Candidatus Daviesbacteria bacterium]
MSKLLLTFVCLLFLIILSVFFYSYSLEKSALEKNPKLGVTFSDKYARYLGLNPIEVLEASIKELKVKNIRVPLYWDQIEKAVGEYEFSDVDKYVNLISKNGGKIILVIGNKVPRWPECHTPTYLKNLSKERKQERLLKYLEIVVKRYDKNPSIVAWQIENEPFLNFGICPKLDKQSFPTDREFLEKEISLVRSLTQKPTIVTDSGELTTWKNSLKLSDILGISVYRVVHDPFFSYVNYPFSPSFYSLKDKLLRFLFPSNNKETIIVELQAEGWFTKGIRETKVQEQIKAFPVKNIEKNLQFAKKTGFAEVYFWGLEWWYYLKLKGHSEYWEKAKEIFNN